MPFDLSRARPRLSGFSRRSARRSRRNRAASTSPLRTLVEHLEQRVLLAADPLGSCVCDSEITTIAWQGREVEAIRDSWLVRMPTPVNPLSVDFYGYESRAPRAPSGWAVESLNYGFYSVRAPGASQQDVAGWGVSIGALGVEPNFVLESTATPNDPSYTDGSLWGLDMINAPTAWDSVTGSRSIVLGVVDSGVDVTHPDLAANIWRNPGETPGNGIDDDGNGFVDDVHGWNFGDDDDDLSDSVGHGTHVAGTMGAVGNNSVGVTGVNWTTSLMVLKLGDIPTSASATSAINYVTSMRGSGIPIVATNNSYGNAFSSLFESAIRLNNDAGVLFVAAAGNSSSDNDLVTVYPANYDSPNIITVAASDESDALAGFSNYGLTTVDIAAPGVGILSTVPVSVDPSGYVGYSGTSMAAPHVAGVAGLIASAYFAETGELPPVEVMRSAILDGADVIPTVPGVSGLTNPTTQGVVAGNRRLNALGALQQLPLVVSISDAVVTEGADGTQATAQVTITLSRAVDQPVTVTYATRDGSATLADDDYVPISGQVVFAPGQTTRAVTLTVNGDDWFERDESFTVAATSISYAPSVVIDGSVTILNDDPEILRVDVLPAIALRKASPTVAEFVVRVADPIAEPLRIAYTTIDDTARSRRDYRSTTGIIEFRPGQQEKRIPVGIRGSRRPGFDTAFALGLEVLDGPDALLYNPTDGSRDAFQLAVPGVILDTNSRHFSIVPDAEGVVDDVLGFTIELDRLSRYGDVLPELPGVESLPPDLLAELGQSIRFSTEYMVGHQYRGRIARRPPAGAAEAFDSGAVELGYVLDEVTGEVVTKTSERIEVPVIEGLDNPRLAAELVSPVNARIKAGAGRVTLGSVMAAASAEAESPRQRRLAGFRRWWR